MALLVLLQVLGPTLRNSFTRFYIDNQAAKFALINCYSGNAFMARLSAEIWMLLLEYNITPFFDYVPSDDNVSDLFSRPDLVEAGDTLPQAYSWQDVDPLPHIPALVARVRRAPNMAWTHLWTTLYGGTQHQPRAG